MLRKQILNFLVLSMLVGINVSCVDRVLETTPTVTPSKITEEKNVYMSDEYSFSFTYSNDWLIEREDYREIVLTPISGAAWQPTTPADFPKDPKIQFALGEFAMTGVFETHSPTITLEMLRARLEEKVSYGTYKDFYETTIDDNTVFEITEYYDPGCYKVVYWRPDNISSVIKISTGCDSPYLADFKVIVNSLRTID